MERLFVLKTFEKFWLRIYFAKLCEITNNLIN